MCLVCLLLHYVVLESPGDPWRELQNAVYITDNNNGTDPCQTQILYSYKKKQTP